jgi:glutamyl-tRNA reductase
MLCYYDPQLQQTAKELYEIVENNGKALKRGADDESNQLANLFRKIDEKVESFRNTSIESIYNNLKNAESEFLAIQKKLYANHLDKKSIPNVKDAANDLIDQFNERLIPRLNTEADENPGLYDKEIAMINLIIDKTEKVQRARIARNDTTDEPVEITEDKELQNTP